MHTKLYKLISGIDKASCMVVTSLLPLQGFMNVRSLIINATVIGFRITTSNEERGIDLWTVALAGSGPSKFSLVHEAQFRGEMSNKIKSYRDTYRG